MKKIKLLYISPNKIDFNKSGKIPSVSFYGADKFNDDEHFELGVLYKKNKLLQILWRPFNKLLRRKTINFDISKVLTNIKFINKHDIVLGETDSCGLPVVLLKKLGFIKPKVVFISAGLINRLEERQNTLLFKIYKWFLPAADLIVCWSPLEEKLYKDLIGANAKFILLEADTQFYKPDFETPYEDFILAIGNDRGRDWKTLFKVLKQTKIPAKVITGRGKIARLNIPENVGLHTEKVPYDVLFSWYNKARFVIINTKEIHRFTGQRALLEALAMGKATIAAKTKALTSTYNLKDGKNIIFYEPENPEDLKRKNELIYNNEEKLRTIGRNARRFTEMLPKDSFFQNLKQHLLSLL